MTNESFSYKQFFFGKINRKLTLLFLVIGILAPTIGIYYFYLTLLAQFPESITLFENQQLLYETIALLIISLIAFNAAIFGFFISRSLTKPISILHQATQEIEKGNFSVRTDIRTGDELEQLSQAFNKTTYALSKMNDERTQLDKTKSEFLSITSHELRTPMTPMKAQLQMLLNGYFGDLSEKQKESITIIMKNAERLNKIIEDFLEISRIEAARLKFNFRETNLLQTIQETIGLLEGFAKEKHIVFNIKVDKLPVIKSDPDRISQVLRNLVHNAIKFSKENSSIEIGAEQYKDHIHFSVKDTGVGIDSLNQIRIFEPFYQVQENMHSGHGGTGLGLTICRGIIEAQKGKIWVESEPERGSIFHFTVPIKPIEEIEPIKLLFSSKLELENKLQETFTNILGPLGKNEFSELRNKNAIGRNDIIQYIDTLQEHHFIREENATTFKHQVNSIYGTQPH